jgi:2-polyprenyl-3-methyl-5-hydroxy-6-metoxy-1,4-benzoquinol methylase
MSQSLFYDTYHQKNRRFTKVIGENNFTYFYILQFLHLSYLQPFAKKRVLDVGCGVGALSLYLATKGALVVGVDVSDRAIRLANSARQALDLENVKFVRGELATGKGRFDFVICSEVIEHVPDDLELARRLYSQLNPGGYLLLSTPLTENWLYKIGWYAQFDQEVGHLRRYTQTGIQRLLEQVGFEVVLMKPVEGALRNVLYTSRLGFAIRFIRGPLVKIFHLFDRWSRLWLGPSNVILLLRKSESC